jgi:hypothetical protein
MALKKVGRAFLSNVVMFEPALMDIFTGELAVEDGKVVENSSKNWLRNAGRSETTAPQKRVPPRAFRGVRCLNAGICGRRCFQVPFPFRNEKQPPHLSVREQF